MYVCMSFGHSGRVSLKCVSNCTFYYKINDVDTLQIQNNVEEKLAHHFYVNNCKTTRS